MNDLKEVYRAKDPSQGGMVVAMLQQEGIDASMEGAILSSAGGEVPLGWPTAPQVMVPTEAFDRAREIVVEWENRTMSHTEASDQEHDKAKWTCPECSEEVDADFEMCWNCQYNRTAC